MMTSHQPGVPGPLPPSEAPAVYFGGGHEGGSADGDDDLIPFADAGNPVMAQVRA